MKIKKILSVILIILSFSLIPFFECRAVEETSGEDMIDSFTSDIVSRLDESTLEILEELGLEKISSDSVFDLSFSEVFKCIKGELSLSVKENVSTFLSLAAMLFVMICVSSLKPPDLRQNSAYADVFTLICIIAVCAAVKDNISLVISVFTVTGGFMTTYIPVLTALLAFSGSVTGSVVYNSVTVALAEIISVSSKNILIPFVRIYFALIASSTLNPAVNGDRISHAVNKALVTVISSAAVFFTFFLSVKNVLAGDIDSLALKSGKYLISGLVPVIGTSIGSMFSSIVGSLNLVKSTVGIFVIICVFIINLPVILRLAVCEAGLRLLGFIGEAFGEKNASGIFNGFAGGIRILLTLVIFELVLIIITTGLIITIKGEI